MEKLKMQSSTLMDFFRTNYEVWIGYHAILQESTRTGPSAQLDENLLERILEDDRTRVARVQVKEALKLAELMKAAIGQQKAGLTEE
jgi:hypothetical protein